MENIKRLLSILFIGIALAAPAQESSRSVMRRGNDRNDRRETAPAVTDRMKDFFGNETNANISDADRQWMRVIYRSIDLDKDANAALYFPEEPVEGQENLFRIIMRQLASNTIPAYEYLDGREVFTDQYKVKMRDVLNRFHIPFTEGRGSTERNPKFEIDETDVPTNEVLSYFVIERWEFNTRNNRLRPIVEAICPVLHRTGDFGGEALRYPMFWIKFSDLRPYLASQTIFVDDDNNLPTCTYDDFFTLNLYDGDIYKTRNLKNRSMAQMHPDPNDLRHAQDSIQARLDSFENKLWVPSREQVLAAREAREAAAALAAGDSSSVNQDRPASTSRRQSARSNKKSTKAKTPKAKKPKSTSNSSSSNATRSVRRTRR